MLGKLNAVGAVAATLSVVISDKPRAIVSDRAVKRLAVKRLEVFV